MTAHARWLPAICCALLFASCSNEEASNAADASGRFIDSPVVGLEYSSTDGPAGTTGLDGEFDYRAGERVRFFIGGIEFGEVLGSPVLYPTDLAPDSTGARAGTNMARFLLTLDSDGDNTNGIQLSVGVREASAKMSSLPAAFDVPASDFSSSSLADFARTHSASGALVSAAAAESHLTCSQQDVAADRRPDGICDGVDTDGDGVEDGADRCADTPAQADVDTRGCGAGQRDGDADGVNDAADQCPDTAAGTPVDEHGCSASSVDSDGDGVIDADDQCPNTPAGQAVDASGCPEAQGDRDADDDGVLNASDACPATPAGAVVDPDGCAASQRDSDDDGISDAVDGCPGTPASEAVDSDGCAASQRISLEVPPLRPDGRFFRDATGRIVILQGTFSISKPVHPSPGGRELTDPDYGTELERLGMNSVRLGYHWSALEPVPGEYDQEYLGRVRQVVDKLTDAHVFTLIDSHQDLYGPKYGSRANGFPEWASIDNGIPYEDVGFPAGYFTPAVSHAFDNLWLNTNGVLDAYVAQLGFMAAEFTDNPYILGYDLMNEPWPGTQWSSCFNNAGCPQFDIGVLQPAMDAFAAAVRAQDDDAIVFYEPQFTFDSGAKTWLDAPPDSVRPVGFSFHDLCVMRAVRQVVDDEALGTALQDGCDAFDTQVYINAFEASVRMDATPFATEVLSANERDTAGLECLLERAEDNKMSWNVGQYPSAGNNNRIVLARVFPRATAGTPQRYRFDVRTGHFDYTYTPDHGIDAPTLIAVPLGVHFPDGYVVDVTGATVVSEPDAALLLVENDPQADTVTVALRPPPEDSMDRPEFAGCYDEVDEVLDLYRAVAGSESQGD